MAAFAVRLLTGFNKDASGWNRTTFPDYGAQLRCTSVNQDLSSNPSTVHIPWGRETEPPGENLPPSLDRWLTLPSCKFVLQRTFLYHSRSKQYDWVQSRYSPDNYVPFNPYRGKSFAKNGAVMTYYSKCGYIPTKPFPQDTSPYKVSWKSNAEIPKQKIPSHREIKFMRSGDYHEKLWVKRLQIGCDILYFLLLQIPLCLTSDHSQIEDINMSDVNLQQSFRFTVVFINNV